MAPDFMPQDVLDAELEMHRREKIMDIFSREYMSIPISREDATFKPEMYKYYNETDLNFAERERTGKILSVLLIDPAKTAKLHNAQSGLVVWGIDVESNALYLREALGLYLHPDELYDTALNLASLYNVTVIGLETNSLNEFIMQPFRNAMVMRGKGYQIVELNPRTGKGELSGYEGGKKGRVAGLLPYYRKGLVFHNVATCGAYEQQLMSFPRPRLWDIMDAAAYIVQILQQGNVYLSYNGPDVSVPGDDEYNDLGYDPEERIPLAIAHDRYQLGI